MRFDNKIIDHGFNLPDVANFADVKQEQRLTDTNCLNYINDLKSTYEQNNFIGFRQALENLLNATSKEMPLEDEEAIHIHKSGTQHKNHHRKVNQLKTKQNRPNRKKIFIHRTNSK